MTIPRLMDGPDEEQPPEGCHHYNSLGEVPWDIQKYTTLEKVARLPETL